MCKVLSLIILINCRKCAKLDAKVANLGVRLESLKKPEGPSELRSRVYEWGIRGKCGAKAKEVKTP